MEVMIFIGPTLPLERAREELDALYLPPVAQGDVYRAVRRRPAVIGIVDGYFSNLPSVWHKEILWAMREGIHVFGSSGIGALRAAELDVFGMRGVGEIYQAYSEGRIEDDDEVAMAHGPAQAGYVPLSEAMINLRATFAKAESSGVIDRATRERLVHLAKQMFYPHRTYENILEHLSVDEARDVLARWLLSNRIDQGRIDAIAMLREIRAALDAGLPPLRATFHLERTFAFEQMIASIDGRD